MPAAYKSLLNSALALMLLAVSGCGDASSTPPSGQVATTPAGTVGAVPSISTAAPPLQVFPAAMDFGIPRDPVKYPQDTPDRAFESIAKALEANDLAYQIVWLFTPDFTQRMIEKYKSIDPTVAANQSPEKAEGRAQLLKTIRAMQAAKSTSEGEINGVKWFCYKLGESQLIQLERQRDGRWCLNPKVREKKQ